MRALALVEKALGPKHPRLGQALFILGSVQSRRGDRPAAVATFRRGVVLLEAAGEAPPLGQILLGLAELELQERDPAAARTLVDRALALAAKGPGVESYETAHALSILGKVQLATGDRAGARTSFEKVRELFARLIGTDHPDYRSTVAQLSSL